MNADSAPEGLAPRTPDRRSRYCCRGMREALFLSASICIVFVSATSADQDANKLHEDVRTTSLEETRLKMSKWIETQQIISKERNEWQQGKEILVGRLELVKREIAGLEEKIQEAESKVSATDMQRDELLAESETFKAAGTQLAEAVTAMEVDVHRLCKAVPEPVQTRIQVLHERIPADPANTRVSVAERFQNVLGILNEVTKSNNEITANYEIHTLADGKPAEVQAIYVGLAQGYYVSARGEAGIGRPGAEGWNWQPAKDIGRDVMLALEVLQGKQTPAFVPLPVKLQ